MAKPFEVGDISGDLEITDIYYKDDDKGIHRKYVLVKCHGGCNKEPFEMESQKLRRGGGIRTCGSQICMKRKIRTQNLDGGVAAAINGIYKGYINRAKKTNKEFTFSQEEFVSLIEKNCFYCEEPPSNCFNFNKLLTQAGCKPYYYSSLDRIDSSVGYIQGNCVPCCAFCNTMKMGMLLEEYCLYRIKLYKDHERFFRDVAPFINKINEQYPIRAIKKDGRISKYVAFEDTKSFVRMLNDYRRGDCEWPS